MAQPSYPWPDRQHELGGSKIFYVTREYWQTAVKNYLDEMIQTKLERPVPAEVLARNEKIVMPEKLEED
jgi:hypothetical protein